MLHYCYWTSLSCQLWRLENESILLILGVFLPIHYLLVLFLFRGFKSLLLPHLQRYGSFLDEIVQIDDRSSGLYFDAFFLILELEAWPDSSNFIGCSLRDLTWFIRSTKTHHHPCWLGVPITSFDPHSISNQIFWAKYIRFKSTRLLSFLWWLTEFFLMREYRRANKKTTQQKEPNYNPTNCTTKVSTIVK